MEFMRKFSVVKEGRQFTFTTSDIMIGLPSTGPGNYQTGPSGCSLFNLIYAFVIVGYNVLKIQKINLFQEGLLLYFSSSE